MRFLLISDTHGKLGIIDELAARVQAEAVIHSGDFGFFDDDSPERLSDRELRLHVRHSDLPPVDKVGLPVLSRSRLIEQIKSFSLLGGFQSYLDGRESFQVPVYAVWGNHEDKEVVERLLRHEVVVENLHMLHHRQWHQVGPAFVYGLGGNLLPGSKMMQRPVAGGGGKIWSTLSQYLELIKAVEKDSDPGSPRIFVSHISPGKEPFVELVGARTRAEFTISGHMGAPSCLVWNPFTVRSLEEAEKRLRKGLVAVKRACMAAAAQQAQWAEETFEFISRIPEDTVGIDTGVREPRWYRRMTHINLPDADVGYAVMDVDESGSRLQTFIL